MFSVKNFKFKSFASFFSIHLYIIEHHFKCKYQSMWLECRINERKTIPILWPVQLATRDKCSQIQESWSEMRRVPGHGCSQENASVCGYLGGECRSSQEPGSPVLWRGMYRLTSPDGCWNPPLLPTKPRGHAPAEARSGASAVRCLPISQVCL